jgi:hydroxymethylbilane synthase
MEITVGARDSRLSQAQVLEVWQAISSFHPSILFHPVWMKTSGDKDKETPLWKVVKTDFFTQEIDTLLIEKKVRIGIHSAKDLPHPLPKGISIVALTKGIDSRDSLVMNEGFTLEALPLHAKIGTSSKRRETAITQLRADVSVVDIRGTIDERIHLLQTKQIEGVIVAEAALIRLHLTHLNRLILDADTDPLQGKLAIVAREEDHEMASLFSAIDSRKRIAVVGPSVPKFLNEDLSVNVIHAPLIHLKPIFVTKDQLHPITHSDGVILTSKHAAAFLYEALTSCALSVSSFIFFCVGEETKATTQTLFPNSKILAARCATQEGLVELLLSIQPHTLFWPRSTKARNVLPKALCEAGIDLIELPLYSPIFSSESINLLGIDSVFFTCPSSVDAFFDTIEKHKWTDLSFQTIGPITQERLEKRLS